MAKEIAYKKTQYCQKQNWKVFANETTSGEENNSSDIHHPRLCPNLLLQGKIIEISQHNLPISSFPHTIFLLASFLLPPTPQENETDAIKIHWIEKNMSNVLCVLTAQMNGSLLA